MKKNMKRFYSFLWLTACLLTITSCQNDNENVVSETVQLSFSLKPIGLDGLEPMLDELTRTSTTINATPKYLLVLDVTGEGVVAQNTIERSLNSVDDLSSPIEMSLTYGSHTLYFLLSVNQYDEYDADKLTVTWGEKAKLNYVWALKKELNVVQGIEKSNEVKLDLAVAQIRLKCKDALPGNIGNVVTSSDGLCWTIDLPTMQGIPSTISHITSASANAGKLDQFFTSYTFIPSTERIGAITYTAYDNSATPQVIEAKTISTVPVKKAYITEYSGTFFSDVTVGFSLSMQDTWVDTIEGTY